MFDCFPFPVPPLHLKLSHLDGNLRVTSLIIIIICAGIVCHDPMMRTLQLQNRRNQDIAAKIAGRAKVGVCIS